MGISKTEAFTQEDNRLADFAKALAHPARVAILKYMIENPACICNDLVDVLPLSQSTVSQHLKELKRIGIIKGNVEPPKVCYCIDEEVWEEAKEMLMKLFFSERKSCC
ncbi:MAG: metalloregulator ArsR/SmtB family transcription factor [Flammeovirgaceae bacterium]